MGFIKTFAERFSLKPYRSQVLTAIQQNTSAVHNLYEKIFADNPVGVIRNVKMYLPLYYIDHIQKIIFQTRDFYEIETLNFLKLHYKRFTHVIDIGSNIGNHALFYCTNMNAKAVDCFEPNERNLQTLKENIRLNFLEKSVRVHPVALGSEAGTGVQRDFTLTNTGMNRIVKTGIDENTEDVIEIKTLDEFKIERADFIKIDVEGFEMEVLKGAINTIRICKPVIMIEVFEPKRNEMDQFMETLGYRRLTVVGENNCIYNSFEIV